MTVRRGLGAVVATALAVFAMGCGSDSEEPVASDATGTTEAGANAEPLVIGFALSQTGFNAAVAQEFLQGLEIWQDMVNNNTGIYADREAAPGLAGRPVEFKFDDDQSKAEEAAKLYEQYITADGVDLVLPPYGSGATGAVAQILARHNFALIGSSAASESIYSPDLPNMVMTVPASSMWLAALPDLMEAESFESVSIVTLDNPFTLDSEEFLKDAFSESGVTVATSDTFASGNKDFTPIWTKVKSADPDVVVIHAFGTDAVTAMKQAAEQQLSPKLWVVEAGAWRNDVFFDGVGAEIAECIVGDAHWSTASETEGSELFAKAYVEEYGDPADGPTGSDPSAAWGFAAGQALTAALDAVGPEGLEDQQLIVDYLKSGDFAETVLGGLSPDENGVNTAGEPALFQFQDGERVIVAPDGAPLVACDPKG
jgi:branched-chain amino acid transport system substrate-binding protein